MSTFPLRQAAERIVSGDLKGGQALLVEMVRQQPDSEDAWMWLAASTDQFSYRRFYLQKALQINPHNALAQQVLADDRIQREWLVYQLEKQISRPAKTRPSAVPAPDLTPIGKKQASDPARPGLLNLANEELNPRPNRRARTVLQVMLSLSMVLVLVVILELVVHSSGAPYPQVLASFLQATLSPTAALKGSTPEQQVMLTPTLAPSTAQLGIQSIQAAAPVSTVDPTQTSLPTPTLDPNTDWTSLPIIPEISSTARAIYQKGLALGNNPNAFSKVGDCNTLSPRFLTYFDEVPAPDYYNLQSFSYLQLAISQFSGSFKRVSQAVGDGFNTSAILSPFRADPKSCNGNESPLECEYRVHKPSFALIAIGTDDYLKPADFEANLRKIVETSINLGIVPILATKVDDVNQLNYNPIIAKVAQDYDIPLWNLWLAQQPLPHQGLEDNEHPDGEFAAFDFTDANLTDYGWPVRNLTALQVLYTVWQGVSQ